MRPEYPGDEDDLYGYLDNCALAQPLALGLQRDEDGDDDLYGYLDKSIESIGLLLGTVDGLVGFDAHGWSAQREALLLLREQLEQSREELTWPWQGDVGLQCEQAWMTLGHVPRAQALLLQALPWRARRAVISQFHLIHAFVKRQRMEEAKPSC